VVAESRNPRGGKVIDSVGRYSPYLRNKPLEVDLDRIQQWRDKGAIPSDAVKRLLRLARRQAERGAAEPKPSAKKARAAEEVSAEPTGPADAEPAAESSEV
jgi:small subunit ribosomal protein S16